MFKQRGSISSRFYTNIIYTYSEPTSWTYAGATKSSQLFFFLARDRAFSKRRFGGQMTG